MINGKHGQGTHSTKRDADKLAYNTPNAPKNFSPLCLPTPRIMEFSKKAFSGCLQSVVETLANIQKKNKVRRICKIIPTYTVQFFKLRNDQHIQYKTFVTKHLIEGYFIHKLKVHNVFECVSSWLNLKYCKYYANRLYLN